MHPTSASPGLSKPGKGFFLMRFSCGWMDGNRINRWICRVSDGRMDLEKVKAEKGWGWLERRRRVYLELNLWGEETGPWNSSEGACASTLEPREVESCPCSLAPELRSQFRWTLFVTYVGVSPNLPGACILFPPCHPCFSTWPEPFTGPSWWSTGRSLSFPGSVLSESQIAGTLIFNLTSKQSIGMCALYSPRDSD